MRIQVHREGKHNDEHSLQRDGQLIGYVWRVEKRLEFNALARLTQDDIYAVRDHMSQCDCSAATEPSTTEN